MGKTLYSLYIWPLIYENCFKNNFVQFTDGSSADPSHRRSKSILKNKSDAARLSSDPESERLLSDNMSGSGISDISVIAVSIQFDCRLHED